MDIFKVSKYYLNHRLKKICSILCCSETCFPEIKDSLEETGSLIMELRKLKP